MAISKIRVLSAVSVKRGPSSFTRAEGAIGAFFTSCVIRRAAEQQSGERESQSRAARREHRCRQSFFAQFAAIKVKPSSASRRPQIQTPYIHSRHRHPAGYARGAEVEGNRHKHNSLNACIRALFDDSKILADSIVASFIEYWTASTSRGSKD